MDSTAETHRVEGLVAQVEGWKARLEGSFECPTGVGEKNADVTEKRLFRKDGTARSRRV